MKKINEREDLNEEETKKQFASKSVLNKKGKTCTFLFENDIFSLSFKLDIFLDKTSLKKRNKCSTLNRLPVF